MSIEDKLLDAKNTVSEIKRNYKFKKANQDRKNAAELQSALMKCRGKLEICSKDFNRSIKEQSRNIARGKQEGADTLIQEQMLWDASIGYLLVRDAIFSLKTISSHDSIAHAYEMLDAATQQIAGKSGKLPKFPRIGTSKERNAYGYITSDTALKEKEELLDSIFEQLKVSGDIESCLNLARNPGEKQGEVRSAYLGGKNEGASDPISESDIDQYMRRMREQAKDGSAEDHAADLDSMTDIHPPED